ncbi:hypothetical protein F5Y04DRAFT_212888 [Hypomontagnella monticulosa]|nr:hypothetical protein F5Y04DRAFT_212888 [Hypomontagnella monticulosa]
MKDRQTPKQRHKRARTGCERCRAQHRKCDEKKPQCQRCTDAGATCKYVAHISFLDKNFRSISNDAASSLSVASDAPGRPTLEFVFNNFSSTQDASSPPSASTSLSDAGRPHVQVNSETSQDSQSMLLTDDLRAKRKNEDRAMEREDGPTPEKNNLRHQNLQAEASQTPINWEMENRWPLAGHSSLSDDEIGLLKHYTHHIAPWVDVYDQSQTFSHLVTQLAMNSPCVLEGILELSAAFSGRPKEIVKRRGASALHLQVMSIPADVAFPFDLRLMTGFVLARTLLFVQAVPDSWRRTFHEPGPSFEGDKFDRADAPKWRTWYTSLALLSRLEIAYYLMNQAAPGANSESIYRILRLPRTPELSADRSQNIMDASLQCLALLADVMNLCLPASEIEDDYTGQPSAAVSNLAGVSRVAKGKELLEELWAWHTNRPPELQQLMETDSREATFPVVIFAAGAGVSSNTLYHTAMLLLLSNRPQSVSVAEWKGGLDIDAAQLSPHWHARRVCGIAANSDPEHTHCWDPCMIAAFAFAARRMTHPSQQKDILACLDCVKMAGWNIDGLSQKLRDEWGPID